MLNKFQFGSLPLTEPPGLGQCDLKSNLKKNHLQNGQSVEGATESGMLGCWDAALSSHGHSLKEVSC